jgi:photosystem II stability/assembly factor-like uncharacterized protein
VGTGENNNQRSVGYGNGIYKSLDGGKSFTNMGLKNSEHIGMIKVHPNNSNVVFVAAYGPLWKEGGERGLYKTEDGGKTWNRIYHVSDNTGCNEIHIDPSNPNGHTWVVVRKAHFTRAQMVVKPGENYRVGCPEAMWEELPFVLRPKIATVFMPWWKPRRVNQVCM